MAVRAGAGFAVAGLLKQRDPSHTQGREGLKTEGNPSTGRRDWDSSPGRPAGTDGDWVFWPS